MSEFIRHTITKFEAVPIRLFNIIKKFPLRLQRLGGHLTDALTGRVNRKDYWAMEANNRSRATLPFLWGAELIILLLELAGAGELYETGADFFKYKTRPLTRIEIALARSVFGEAIDYRLVRIDETSWLGPKQYDFCYVSFHLINSWGKMTAPVLIHELVHVWQYQQFGARYMLRALVAQHSEQGYNYGGLKRLKQLHKNNLSLLELNFEQQADLVMDYFLIKNGYSAQWGLAGLGDLEVYEQLVRSVFSSVRRSYA